MVRKTLRISMLLPILCMLNVSSNESNDDPNKKIIYEFEIHDAIHVSDDMKSLDMNETESNQYSMQVRFNYAAYTKESFEKQHKRNETFDESSRRHHTEKNQECLRDMSLDLTNIFVSAYTPYIFIDCPINCTTGYICSVAQEIAKNDCVEDIHVFPTDIYNLIIG